MALRVAAGYDHPARGVGRFEGESVAYRFVGLVLGRPQETAGVEENDVGLARVFDEPVSGLAEIAGHHLAVDEVLSAAERDEGDLFQG
jgi:hypothetical protein